MRHPRLFVDQPLSAGARAELDRDCAHYLGRVLRLRPGAAITLFNGRGGEYPATLAALSRARASADLGPHDPVERESALAITLIQGISRGQRMDYTIQKAVELGAARIIAWEAARSVVRLNDERRRKRLVHWQAVARSAAMQCGRNRIPPVCEEQSLDAALAGLPAGRLLLDPEAQTPLSVLVRPQNAEVALLIGPEGGLSPHEVGLARREGFRALRLGPRVLRTETAGAAALAALQTLWGDLA